MCSSMSIAALRLRLVLVAGAAVSTTALAPAFGGAASGASPAAGEAATVPTSEPVASSTTRSDRSSALACLSSSDIRDDRANEQA